MSWVRHGARLAMYGPHADAAFWSVQWERVDRAHLLAQARRDLVLRAAFARHLPRAGRILEAGAGLGQWVELLREWGYDVEGVEWSAATVAAVRAARPDLPLHVGDVTRLDRPDGAYAAVVCLGVAEHLPTGPEPVLHELRRVLAAEGVLLISVPYLSPLRRVKAALGRYPDRAPDGGVFYQYAFAPAEFAALLDEAGFTVADQIPYDALLGIRSEVGPLNALYTRTYAQPARPPASPRGAGLPVGLPVERDPLAWRVARAVVRWAPLRWWGAHMVLYVAGKR